MMNAKIINLPKIVDPRGNLSIIEQIKQIPFEIKRAHWIYDVPGGVDRGGHAFKETEEFVVALSGSFDVVVDSRALDIVDAKVGSSYAVIDMGGRIVRSGIVSNGTQRVDVSKSGSYMVRVGREAMQVNVK